MKIDRFESRYFTGDILGNDKVKDMDLRRSHKALTFIKSKFHQYVKEFLKDELALTTAKSEGYVAESQGKWKSGYTDVIMPGLTYEEYHSWFMGRLAAHDEIALQMGHPDHYLNAMSKTEAKTVEIIENLGEDDLPWYLIGEFVDADTVPLERDMEYPEEFCLKIKSSNGIVLGYAAHEFKNDENGDCDIKLTIILPEKAPDSLVVGHLNHFTVEFRNWYSMALAEKQGQL